ncbi:TPA_asm: hypothetical protein [ssRNA phage Gerhypos.4_17]|uniref:Uncharacterized protein n=2 Tax=Fiersviridae TaxID=2842319 RepID=A0A8S5L2E6_9VIRU|nr:hypothetical protein QIJ23_gp3 [ssRNA phage Gerhypos.4_17]QDH91524.1 MAG: hypothetical protein H4Bulk46476_000002 [Leviviridae sp.]DAD51588.1 TPA_asm: hypothetical protein [ssRNA phage Gerhypos.4_17]
MSGNDEPTPPSQVAWEPVAYAPSVAAPNWMKAFLRGYFVAGKTYPVAMGQLRKYVDTTDLERELGNYWNLVSSEFRLSNLLEDKLPY